VVTGTHKHENTPFYLYIFNTVALTGVIRL
jgi:hypothetical protein